MVIRGNSRGNAGQLSHYLLAKKENDAIRILDVDGQSDPEADDLHRAVYLMGVSAELSKSEKGIYHAQINPAIGEDARMMDEHWLQACDILGQQLGLETQRRAIVLHTKKGRTHAHVVWERYDHENEKMVSDSFSRLAQDRARKEMEAAFNQTATPHRNKHRAELKAALTELWQQTDSGALFIQAAQLEGYLISEGSGRSPYMVVDQNGRSYDLTRQLEGVRLKEVRHRLRNEKLLTEKAAIIGARKTREDAASSMNDTTDQQMTVKTDLLRMKEKNTDNQKDVSTLQNSNKNQVVKGQFKDNKTDLENTETEPKKTIKENIAENTGDITGQEKQRSVAELFAENKKDKAKNDIQTDKEKRREEFKRRMQPKPSQDRSRGKGMDYD